MWMYTASPNPPGLLPPALLGLTSSQVTATWNGGIGQWRKRLPFCQTKCGTFLPHTAPSPPCQNVTTRDATRSLAWQCSCKKLNREATAWEGNKGLHSNWTQDIYSILWRITRFWVCSDSNKKMKYQSSAEWNSSSPPSSSGSWGAWKSWHQGCWLAADWDSQALTLPSACQEGCRGAGPANWLETREVSLRTLLCFRWNFIKICLANISILTKKSFVEIFLTSSRDLSLMINLVSLVKLKMLVF